jgi:hypothetical protein
MNGSEARSAREWVWGRWVTRAVTPLQPPGWGGDKNLGKNSRAVLGLISERAVLTGVASSREV